MKLLTLTMSALVASTHKIHQTGIFSQMEQMQTAELTQHALKLERLKQKQKDLEDWEKEHDLLVQKEEEEKAEKEREMISHALHQASQWRKPKGKLESLIDVSS